jgi:hypothetical protein
MKSLKVGLTPDTLSFVAQGVGEIARRSRDCAQCVFESRVWEPILGIVRRALNPDPLVGELELIFPDSEVVTPVEWWPDALRMAARIASGVGPDERQELSEAVGQLGDDLSSGREEVVCAVLEFVMTLAGETPGIAANVLGALTVCQGLLAALELLSMGQQLTALRGIAEAITDSQLEKRVFMDVSTDHFWPVVDGLIDCDDVAVFQALAMVVERLVFHCADDARLADWLRPLFDCEEFSTRFFGGSEDVWVGARRALRMAGRRVPRWFG